LKQAEFRCKWIRREDICQCAEGIRNQYWPSGKLPVDMEHIIESDLKLYIDPNLVFSKQPTWRLTSNLIWKESSSTMIIHGRKIRQPDEVLICP
jgi:hypothetical protein